MLTHVPHKQLTWRPVLHFAGAMLQAGLADWRTAALSLFTPLFMLVLFWLIGRPAEPGDPDLATFIFPAIVGLTVMLGGQTLAMRLVNWRTQGVFQRLAATPTPVGHLVLGLGLAQAVLSVVQAVSVLAFGALALGLPVDGLGAVLALGVLALGVSTFSAYGMLVASLAPKADVASSIFIFTLLPLFFLGGGFPAEILPAFLRPVSPWLPTTMVNTLLNPLLTAGTLPPDPAWPALGLLGYTLGLAALAAWRFRWE